MGGVGGSEMGAVNSEFKEEDGSKTQLFHYRGSLLKEWNSRIRNCNK